MEAVFAILGFLIAFCLLGVGVILCLGVWAAIFKRVFPGAGAAVKTWLENF